MTSGCLGRDHAVHRPGGSRRWPDGPAARPSLASGATGLELALDEVQGALGAIHEDEATWAEREDLSRELGADRAAGTGDHDRAVTDQVSDGIGVLGRRRSTKEVLDLYPADTVGVERAIEQVVHRGHGPDFEAAGHGRIDDPSD